MFIGHEIMCFIEKKYFESRFKNASQALKRKICANNSKFVLELLRNNQGFQRIKTEEVFVEFKYTLIFFT